jgi:hypothetical protein
VTIMPKHELFENIPLHVQKLNYRKGILKLKDCVGEYTLSLDLSPKLGLPKKTYTSFLKSYLCMIKGVGSHKGI